MEQCLSVCLPSSAHLPFPPGSQDLSSFLLNRESSLGRVFLPGVSIKKSSSFLQAYEIAFHPSKMTPWFSDRLGVTGAEHSAGHEALSQNTGAELGCHVQTAGRHLPGLSGSTTSCRKTSRCGHAALQGTHSMK